MTLLLIFLPNLFIKPTIDLQSNELRLLQFSSIVDNMVLTFSFDYTVISVPHSLLLKPIQITQIKSYQSVHKVTGDDEKRLCKCLNSYFNVLFQYTDLFTPIMYCFLVQKCM